MSRLTLQFRLGSIPVRIEPGFWLITLLLGSRLGTAMALGLWIALELVAVLVHELGHATAARAFGARPEIILHSMGGVTRYAVPQGRSYGRAQAMMTSFAGPLAGFLLAGVTFLAALAFAPGGGSLAERALTIYELTSAPRVDNPVSLALALTLFINVGWGIINLLPILPLDGGNILRAVLGGSQPESGTVRALWVSCVIGPGVTFLFLRAGSTWGALLFGYFSFMSIKQLIDMRKVHADRSAGLHTRIEDAQQAIADGDLDRAEAQAKAALDLAASPVVRRTAVHVMAVARLERGDARSALDVLRNLPDSETDPFLLGATLLACGRAEDAIPHLERAISAGAGDAAREMLERARRVAQAWNGGAGADRPGGPPGS